MLLNQIAGDKDLLFEYEGFFEEFQKRLALHQWLPKEILAGISENKELSRAMDWVLRQKNSSDSQDYGDIIVEAFWAGWENTDNVKSTAPDDTPWHLRFLLEYIYCLLDILANINGENFNKSLIIFAFFYCADERLNFTDTELFQANGPLGKHI